MTKISTDPYTRLFNAFLDAYSSTNTKKCFQDEENKSWKEIKEICSKATERSTHVETKIKELKAISMKRKGVNMMPEFQIQVARNLLRQSILVTKK